MLRLRPLACALVLLALPASRAAAQEPPPAPPPPPAPSPPQPAPQQGYPQPTYPQPAYPQPAPPAELQPVYPPGTAPPPGYAQPGYAQPGYAQPGYAQPGYGQPAYYGQPFGLPPGPPPPPPKPSTLRWSLRYDPFELVVRRMTFQAEIAVAGPFAIEVVPSWIWGSPYGGIDEHGFAIAGNAVFYLSGMAFRGMWLKAHFEYENFSATFANPGDATLVGQPQQLSSAIIGALFGDSLVIPRTGGFILSGGIGVGVATAPKATLVSGGNGFLPAQAATLYDGLDRVRLLGSLGLGVAF